MVAVGVVVALAVGVVVVTAAMAAEHIGGSSPSELAAYRNQDED